MEAFRCGDYVRSEKEYSAELKPGDVKCLLNRCLVRIRLGKSSEAIMDADEVLLIEPLNWKAVYRKACALGQLGKYCEAVHLLKGVDLGKLPSSDIQAFRCKMSMFGGMVNKDHDDEESIAFAPNKIQTYGLHFKGYPAPPTMVEMDQVFRVGVFLGNEFGLFSPLLMNKVDLLVNSYPIKGMIQLIDEPVLDDHGRCEFRVRVVSVDTTFQIYVQGSGAIEPILSCPIGSISPSMACSCKLIQMTNQSFQVYQSAGELGIGGKLWDSATVLIRFLESRDLKEKTVLELGAGTGAVGIACALLGASDVLITDLPQVVPLISANIANILNAHASPLVWGIPPYTEREFDIVVMSDVVYDPEFYQPLVDTLRGLEYDTVVWAHRSRHPDEYLFFEMLRDEFALLRIADGQRNGENGTASDVARYQIKKKKKKKKKKGIGVFENGGIPGL